MTKSRIHTGTLLARNLGEWISGEQISRGLGITRSAIWKELSGLRAAGWPISASTGLGYRLDAPPATPSQLFLNAVIPADSIFAGGSVMVLPLVDSTNTWLKANAAALPSGAALIAEEQSGGRGTHGRSFQSPKGEGLYLSVLLRPHASIEQILTLTGWAAVAVRDAIETASGAPAEIKWLNDIYLHGRKLVGILTELSLLSESAEPDYVVIGMGVNLTQTDTRFQELGLQDIAISLAGAGYPVNPNTLALAILQELDHLFRDFPRSQDSWLERYRAFCITPGHRVSFELNGTACIGTATGLDRHFGLVVLPDGSDSPVTVSSGTVRMLPDRHSTVSPKQD